MCCPRSSFGGRPATAGAPIGWGTLLLLLLLLLLPQPLLPKLLPLPAAATSVGATQHYLRQG